MHIRAILKHPAPALNQIIFLAFLHGFALEITFAYVIIVARTSWMTFKRHLNVISTHGPFTCIKPFWQWLWCNVLI